jgi:hypothetical protein
MIEKLMLDNNFCCVWIADLSNSVFMFPWQPWTLLFKCPCYQFKSWHLVITSVIWKSLWPKEDFNIIWNAFKMFIFVSMATIHISKSKMQHMNHIDSNFATINISPTAWFLGGAILNYTYRLLFIALFDDFKPRP